MNKYKTLPLGALCATIAALALSACGSDFQQPQAASSPSPEFVRHKSPDFTTHKLGKSPDYIP